MIESAKQQIEHCRDVLQTGGKQKMETYYNLILNKISSKFSGGLDGDVVTDYVMHQKNRDLPSISHFEDRLNILELSLADSSSNHIDLFYKACDLEVDMMRILTFNKTLVVVVDDDYDNTGIFKTESLSCVHKHCDGGHNIDEDTCGNDMLIIIDRYLPKMYSMLYGGIDNYNPKDLHEFYKSVEDLRYITSKTSYYSSPSLILTYSANLWFWNMDIYNWKMRPIYNGQLIRNCEISHIVGEPIPIEIQDDSKLIELTISSSVGYINNITFKTTKLKTLDLRFQYNRKRFQSDDDDSYDYRNSNNYCNDITCCDKTNLTGSSDKMLRDSIFSNIKTLETLYISRAVLSNFTHFTCLPSLKKLTLNSCYVDISTISGDMFHNDAKVILYVSEAMNTDCKKIQLELVPKETIVSAKFSHTEDKKEITYLEFNSGYIPNSKTSNISKPPTDCRSSVSSDATDTNHSDTVSDSD